MHNPKVTVFTVSGLLRENQQKGMLNYPPFTQINEVFKPQRCHISAKVVKDAKLLWTNF